MGASPKEVIRRILAENPKKTISDPLLSPAGVLLLLYPKDGEYCVLLNRRTDQVEHHKGEISFPGGSKDANDATLLDTALRETYEEMGIRPEDVEVLGQVDDTPTTTNFLISTTVGTIPYPYDFNPSELEVAEVLEVPLTALMDDETRRDEVRIVGDELDHVPSYVYKGHLIFGATARVLSRFLELLETAPSRERLWTSQRQA
jgi:8-oxo-dGTP pyrophosphatase MutT (NUDIX family)